MKENKKIISLVFVFIFVMNMVVPLQQVKGNEIINVSLFKNSGFEDGSSYWSIWGVQWASDTTQYKEGTKALKIYGNPTGTVRGMVSQTVSVGQALGKTISIKQWIKSENFNGSFKLRATFKNSSGTTVGAVDVKEMYIKNTSDWQQKQYLIDVPNDSNIQSMGIDYIYDNSSGTLWMDGITTDIVDTIVTTNAIKNGDFEEELSYWSLWAIKGEIDTTQYKQGTKSLKIYGDSTSPVRGMVSQTVNVGQALGKTISIKQWIKSENFNGSFKLRATFKNSSGTTVGAVDVKEMYIKSTSDWQQKQYLIDVPNDSNIQNVAIDYIYDNSIGTLWIDGVTTDIVYTTVTTNAIKNGDFEEELSYWSIWAIKGEIDTTQYKQGTKSLKIYGNSTSPVKGMLSQTVNVSQALGKTISIKQWIKSENFNGSFKLRATFKNSSGTTVGAVDVKEMYIKNTLDWQQKQYLIDVPNDSNIQDLGIDYIYDSSIGTLWIDGITTDIVDTIVTTNVVKNGDFEEELSYWSSWSSGVDFKSEIDNVEYKGGNKSFKLYSGSNNIARGIVSQSINIKSALGKTLKIEQWIKSQSFSGNLRLRATLTNSSGQSIGQADIKDIYITGTTDWQLKTFFIDIPNDSNIQNVNLEYIYDNSVGVIWIDCINANIVDTIPTTNIIKNPSFEEEFSSWSVWAANGDFKADIDKVVKQDGNNSLKLSSSTASAARGIVSQKVNIPTELQKKVININQFVKTNNLSGDAIQVRIRFQGANDVELKDRETYILNVTPTEDWKNVSYNVFMPQDQNVYSILIEYIFENCSGEIWFDNIKAEENLNDENKNIIQNGGFESTIKKLANGWTTWYQDSNLTYGIDGQNKKEGNNSLKVVGNGQSEFARFNQYITIDKEALGKDVRLSEYIKNTDSNTIYVTLRYLDDNDNEVVNSYSKYYALPANSDWSYYQQQTKIPNNSNIKKIAVDYRIKNAKGTIWVDDIRMEPYVAITDVQPNPTIIELTKSEIKKVEFNILPQEATQRELKVFSADTNIVNVNENNQLVGVNKGITKIRVEQPYEKTVWEFPVSVDTGTNIKVDKVTNINVSQGQSAKGKVNVQTSTQNLKYSMLISGRDGYTDLRADGSFDYYPNRDFYGKDSFTIKVEDALGNLAFAQYNVQVSKSTLDIGKNKFLVTLSEGQKAEDKIKIDYPGTANFSILNAASNGTFTLQADGTYSYVPKQSFFGYDNAQIKVVTDTNETINMDVQIYVAPSANTMLSKLSTENPRTLIGKGDINRIKNLVNTDDNAKAWLQVLRSQADAILVLPVVPYSKEDGLRLLTKSKEYIEQLSFMYTITGESKYAQRAWSELDNICKYPDWNDQHFIDTSAMSVAAAIGYEWLYDYLDANQKQIIETAIKDKALKIALTNYANDSWFNNAESNWNIVCNSGMIFSSLAIANNGNSDITMKVVEEALKSIQSSLTSYYSDGSSSEGPGYWEFATQYLMYGATSIENALKINNPFEKMVDMNKLAEFSVVIGGQKGSLNFADAGEGFVPSYFNLWFAKKLNNAAYTKYSKVLYDKTKITSIYDLIWYDPSLYNKASFNLLDYYFNRSEVVTMRSNLVKDYATFVGFKGGATGNSHGDLDIGNFVYDALGVRWAIDLGADSYNLPGYFDTDPLGNRWQYYRKRAEGHNTLVIGKSANEDQVVGTTSKIIQKDINSSNPYAVLDMTPAYGDKAAKVNRKVQLNNNRKDLIIEDEFVLKQQDDVVWQMHTKANVQILDNGKSLMLTQNGERMKMVITADYDTKFEVISAKPYLDSPNPSGQDPNADIKKIIARGKTQSGKLKVEMIPQGDINTVTSGFKDGGFETGLEQWVVWNQTGNLKIEVDSSVVKEGNKSIKVSNANGIAARGTLAQTVDVSKLAGTKVKITQMAKSEALLGQLMMRCTFIDSKGNEFGDKVIQTEPISQTQDWNLMKNILSIPQGTSKIVVEYLYDNATGIVWLDDVKVSSLEGDVNDDTDINVLDLALVAQQYDVTKAQNNWNEKFDFNLDGTIDIYDLTFISNKMN